MEVQKLFQCDLNQKLLTKVGPCALQIFFLAGYSMSFHDPGLGEEKKKESKQKRLREMPISI